MKKYSLAQNLGIGMLAVCATVVQASFVMAAHATDAPNAQAIRSSDLDLAKSTDVATLYHRIRTAAEAVCGTGVTTGSRLPSRAWQTCVADAVNGAVARINKASLSAYHHQELVGSKEAGKPGA